MTTHYGWNTQPPNCWMVPATEGIPTIEQLLSTERVAGIASASFHQDSIGQPKPNWLLDQWLKWISPRYIYGHQRPKSLSHWQPLANMARSMAASLNRITEAACDHPMVQQNSERLFIRKIPAESLSFERFTLNHMVSEVRKISHGAQHFECSCHFIAFMYTSAYGCWLCSPFWDRASWNGAEKQLGWKCPWRDKPKYPVQLSISPFTQCGWWLCIIYVYECVHTYTIYIYANTYHTYIYTQILHKYKHIEYLGLCIRSFFEWLL